MAASSRRSKVTVRDWRGCCSSDGFIITAVKRRVKKQDPRTSLSGKDVLALFPVGFGKTFVKHRGKLWLATGCRHVSSVAPPMNRKPRAVVS